MTLKPCPFCGGFVRRTAMLDTVDYKYVEAMCTDCFVEFRHTQNFVYSKTGRVARNASFEDMFNHRVGDDLMERMGDDGK